MRSALIVWGGWEGHDPEECAAIYRRWLHEDGFSVRVETSPEVFLEPGINDLSLIVPCMTMGRISTAAAESLAAAIESGVGMGGHHGTMGDSFHDSPLYQFVVGGQWVAHPGGSIDYTVNVTKPDDPIMQGIPASFPYHSEQYYMHVDPGNEVLATTTFSGEHASWIDGVVMPVVWKKCMAKGGCSTLRSAIGLLSSKCRKWPRSSGVASIGRHANNLNHVEITSRWRDVT